MSRADRARAVLRGSPLAAGVVGAVLGGLVAAVVTGVVLRASTESASDPAKAGEVPCDADGPCEVVRTRVEESPATLPRAEVARRVALQLGLDAVQVDCTEELPMVVNASVGCTIPVDSDVSAEAIVTVAGLDDGDVVLDVFGPDGELGRVVAGGPPTPEERWVEALLGLTGGVEPLYHDAATVDAATLTAWAEAASGCAETLEAASSPGPRLGEAARRAGLGCHEMDTAAAAFAGGRHPARQRRTRRAFPRAPGRARHRQLEPGGVSARGGVDLRPRGGPRNRLIRTWPAGRRWASCSSDTRAGRYRALPDVQQGGTSAPPRREQPPSWTAGGRS